jgi:hypothetical protein
MIRHEIMSLPQALRPNGAQAFPQCINFKIEGSGSTRLSGGVAATSFYKASDPGILFDMWTGFDGYPMPGPPLTKLE